MVAAREAAGELGGLSFDAMSRSIRHGNCPTPRSCWMNGSMRRSPGRRDERRKRMEESIYKALYFADNGLDVSGNIPLTRTESDFLIGLTFRYTWRTSSWTASAGIIWAS